jgi:DNA-binding winged helix-turn-helix (wHTH) protein
MTMTLPLQPMLQTSGQHAQEVISFGPFRLCTSERVLKKGDHQPVKLGGRAFDILLVLVQHAGEVVDHKELVAKVWPGVFVEEINLRVQIAALRKALNTGEAGARYLINVPGRGYCFVAPRRRASGSSQASRLPTYRSMRSTSCLRV